MSVIIHLLEVDTYSIGAAVTTTRYFATRGLVSADGDGLPVAGTYYEGRLRDPGSYSRHLFGPGRVTGRSQSARGEVVLDNRDGALDGFRDLALDGRRLVLRRALLAAGALVPGSLETLVSATMEQPLVSWTEVRIQVRDRQAEFANRPLQPTRYAGTGAGEGTAGTTKGLPKPQAYGRVLHMVPVLVDPVLLIYQVHDGRIDAVEALYEGGGTVPLGAPVATYSELASAAPSAGTAVAYHGDNDDGAYVKLGSVPSRKVTATVRADKTGGTYVNTAGAIARRIAERQGGLAAAGVDAAAFAALDAAAPDECGLVAVREMTIGQALDAVLASVGGWWHFDRADVLTVGRIALPAQSATPDLEITLAEIAADGDPVDVVAGADAFAGVPAFQVSVTYQPIAGVQEEAALDATLTAAERDFLTRPSRAVVASDANIASFYPNAPELVFATALTAEAAATAEAQRLLALYSQRRDWFVVRSRARAMGTVEPGAVVKLTAPRFGADNGRLFVLAGLAEFHGDDAATLSLWGGQRIAQWTADMTSITADTTAVTADAY